LIGPSTTPGSGASGSLSPPARGRRWLDEIISGSVASAEQIAIARAMQRPSCQYDHKGQNAPRSPSATLDRRCARQPTLALTKSSANEGLANENFGARDWRPKIARNSHTALWRQNDPRQGREPCSMIDCVEGWVPFDQPHRRRIIAPLGSATAAWPLSARRYSPAEREGSNPRYASMKQAG
jgi:hypothetical protein